MIRQSFFRVILVVLCVILIAGLPFIVSSPNMLNDVKMEMMSDDDEEDEIDFGRLLFSSAFAEDNVNEDELEEEILEEGEFSDHSEWALPLDFTVPPTPNAELYSENGYEDETIRVRLETLVFDEGTTIYTAYIQIAHPSQFRTAVVNPEKLGSGATEYVSTLARKNHAVIALNGDNYIDNPTKTSFEYRMTQKIRSKSNRLKDILIIDDQGDFHMFIKSEGIKEFPEELRKNGRKLVNAFTFGPALVQNGELLQLDKSYGYNPGGREPRAAIGQTGPLSYVMVIVQAKDRSGKSGMSQEKLAKYMHEIGCINAYNLDGGNSAEMILGEQIIKGMPSGTQRGLSDIIYFATMKPQ